MITSVSNSQIRNVVELRKKAKERDRQDLFIVEGIKMLREVPQTHLEKIYVTEDFLHKHGEDPELSQMLNGSATETVSDVCMERMADTKTPQGVICLVRQFHYQAEDLLCFQAPGVCAADGGRSAAEDTADGSQDRVKTLDEAAGSPSDMARMPLIMVLEDVQDPGNVGTILRAGEGAGVSGILLTCGCADVYNPKVTRSTMGSIFRVPFAYTDQLGNVLSSWKEQGIHLYAAHLEGSRSYDLEDYTQPTAFLIGNESRGLTRELADLADHYIHIPMLGKVESLNAAIASSLLMYEAARQRRQKT